MSATIFTLSWFTVFALVMLIAFVANVIIIMAILRDKSMHTSTYFYIINVNIADILLVLSCLPERLANAFGPSEGFHLGMFACYLLPFCQQVSMHAALAFLLVLTIYRCYPAGVPRFLQGDCIRRQIRNYSQTLCIIWVFAIIINLPLFAITKYETSFDNVTKIINNINITFATPETICFTGAAEIWSRTYLILLLVLTYLITGIFLIVIYGQVIHIILTSKKCSRKSICNSQTRNTHYRYLSPNNVKTDPYQTNLMIRPNGRENRDVPYPQSSSSNSTGGSHGRFPPNTPNISAMPLIVPLPAGQNVIHTSPTNSHSTQHLQVIIMLFIVIILYILLLLPYRLFNLLYIVHNQIFQQTFMNESMFQWLVNSVRLLVFLNCALQPITYLIISSRLRQTVLKLLRSWYKCYCSCQCPSTSSSTVDRHYKNDNQALQAYLSHKHQNISPCLNQQRQSLYRDTRPLQTSLNNINLISYPAPTLFPTCSRSRLTLSHLTNKTRYTVSFNNGLRR